MLVLLRTIAGSRAALMPWWREGGLCSSLEEVYWLCVMEAAGVDKTETGIDWTGK